MMTLWTGFKQQHFVSDETIGPNKEKLLKKILKLADVFKQMLDITKITVLNGCIQLLTANG